MFAERARAYGVRSPSATWSAARTSWSSTARASSSTPTGGVVARARQFEEELLGLRARRPGAVRASAEPLADLAEVYAALVLGLRDYVRKNGFQHVGVALSGGIDSALVALLAADALGAERPSPASSCPRPTPALRPRRTRGRSPPTSAPS